MSMDLILYTACAITLPTDLPEPESWKNYGSDVWAYESNTWQVLAVVDEEYTIPSIATDLDGSLRYSTPVVLEPIGADKEGYDFLEATVLKLAEKCGGGVIESPSGFDKIELPEPN